MIWDNHLIFRSFLFYFSAIRCAKRLRAAHLQSAVASYTFLTQHVIHLLQLGNTLSNTAYTNQALALFI